MGRELGGEEFPPKKRRRPPKESPLRAQPPSRMEPAFDQTSLSLLGAKGKRDVLDYCMSLGLIAKERVCPRCERGMILTARGDYVDGYEWLCRGVPGDRHKVKRTVRGGSWFSMSKLSIMQILLTTYYWINKIPNSVAADMAQVGLNAVTHWRSFCRELCLIWVSESCEKIGGPGVIVEIDESKFGKRKYHRGRRLEGRWVFGGVERGSRRSFFQVVESPSKEVLLDVIKTWILPGTTVISDCWQAYECLSEEGFVHLTVEHGLTFRDPETGAHTNSIEGTWAAIKRSLPSTRLCEDQFDSYLAEYLWRRTLGHDLKLCGVEFLIMIREIYPPLERDVAEEPAP